MSQRSQWIWVAVAIGLGVSFGGGCKKKEPEAANPSGKVIIMPILGDNLIRLHWLGKKGIAAETNSSTFMEIWNLPESLRVESRFLDQLSLAPWRLLPGNTNYTVTNAASALLRPLLDDLTENEVYLQVTRLSNQPPEVALAIKLDEGHAALWKANLPAVWNSLLPNIKGENQAWPRGKLELRRSGQWTLVGIGREGNPLLGSLDGTIRANANMPAGLGRLWADGEIVLSKLLPASWLPMGVPRVEFALSGNPEGVSTKAILDFPKALPFEVEPWKVPTNLIHGPIHGFAAAQGLRSLVSGNKLLNDLFGGKPPNQLFTWSQTPYSAFVYAAAPDNEASSTAARLGDFLLEKGNPWLATNANGRFQRAGATTVICTAGNPLMGPYLEVANEPSGDFIVASFGRSDLTNQAAPEWLLRELNAHKDIVFYEREVTGGRVASWLYLGQAMRILFWKSQLPLKSPSTTWLQNISPKLSNLYTVGSKTGPAQLTLNRSSSVGLSAIELHLLADWLESPQFPRGTHTGLAKGMIRPGSYRRTSADPVTVTNQ